MKRLILGSLLSLTILTSTSAYPSAVSKQSKENTIKTSVEDFKKMLKHLRIAQEALNIDWIPNNMQMKFQLRNGFAQCWYDVDSPFPFCGFYNKKAEILIHDSHVITFINALSKLDNVLNQYPELESFSGHFYADSDNYKMTLSRSGEILIEKVGGASFH